jgi:hypothetical protein
MIDGTGIGRIDVGTAVGCLPTDLSSRWAREVEIQVGK